MAYTLNRRLAALINSAGQLNTGKIPNAYITSAMLDSGLNISTSGTIESGNITATGSVTANTGGGNATLGSHLDLGDNQKAKFGASDDLEIYHDGSHSYIDEVGEGLLYIQTDGLGIKIRSDWQGTMYDCIDILPVGVSMKYLGSVVWNTKSGGVLTTGDTETTTLTTSSTASIGGVLTADAGVVVDNITIDGNEIDLSSGNLTLDVAGEIELDADGGKWKFLDDGTQIGRIENSSSNFVIKSSVDNKDIIFQGEDGGSGITALTLDMSNGGRAVFNAGASFYDHVYLEDDYKLVLGDSDDLQIYHDGTDSHIQNTQNNGVLRIRSQETYFLNSDNNETQAKFIENGAVELYHDNLRKLETTSTGIDVTGDVDASGLVKVGVNNSEYANNYIRFKPAGAAYIDHATTGQDINFRVSASSTLDTTPLVVKSTGIDVVNATLTGYLRGPSTFTIDPAAHGDDTGTVVIAGNLQVDGTTTTINSTTVTVDDKNVQLATGSTNKAAADGAGITIDLGTDGTTSINYDGVDDQWEFGKDVDVTGTATLDGLAVDGIATVSSNTGDCFVLNRPDGNGSPNIVFKSNGAQTAKILTNAANDIRLIRGVKNALKIHGDTGDISVYNDGGLAVKLFWDASAEMLTTSGLTINGGGSRQYINSGHIRLSDDYNLEWGGGTNYIRGSNSTGNMSVVATGDITLDADGGDILLKDGGAHWASVYTNGTNTYIQNMVNSGDVYLSGKDGSGNGVNALILDMSAAGAATFNDSVTADKYIMTGGSQIGQDYAYLKSASTSHASLTLRKDSTGADSIDYLQLRSDSNGLLGKISGAGAIGAGDGTASLPSLSFVNDTNTGLYRSASDNLGFAIGGQSKAFFSTTQFNVDAKIVATELDITASQYNKINSYFSGTYTSGFKFSDMNGGIWYNAGTDDLTVSAGHANSKLILVSGGSTALTLLSDQSATFAGTISSGAITSSGSLKATDYRVNEGNSLAGGMFKEKNVTGSGSSLDLAIFAEGVSGGGDIHFMTGGSADIRATIDSTGKVGIGTEVPYFPLHVTGANITNGEAKNNALFFDTTSPTTGTGGGISLGGYTNGTGGDIYHFGNIQGIKENSTAGNYASALLFSTRANGATPVEQMRINSSGNVGIANDNPLQTLSVGGRMNVDQQKDYYGAWIDGNTSSDSWFAVGTWHNNGGRMTAGSSIAAGLHLHTHNTDHPLTLQKDGGNVGIGTTAPNQWASYTDSNATVFQVRDTNQRARVVINGGDGAHLDLVDYAGSANDKHMNMAVDGGVLKFGSLNDAGNAFVKDHIMVMDLGTGDIGIGISSPGNKLHVTSAGHNTYSSTVTKGTNHTGLSIVQEGGNTDMTGVFFGSGGSGSGSHWSAITGSRTAHASHWGTQLNFYTHANDTANLADATQKMIITGDGNVGIGDVNPNDKLTIRAASTIGTVNGHIMLTGDGATVGEGPQIVFSESGVNSSFAGAYIGHARTGGNSVGDLIFGTRATTGDSSTVPTERMRIDSSGNVGIGVVPESWYTGGQMRALQVGGTTAIMSLFNTRSIFANNYYLKSGTGADTYINTDEATQYYQESGNHIWKHASSGTADTTITWSESMRIDSSGNVGIGVTPQSFSKLQVKAATNQNVSIFTNSSGLTIGGITDIGGSAALRIAGAPLHLTGRGGGAGSGPDIAIISNGNVGIGTTDPKRPLQIGATGSFPISFNGNYPDIHFNTYYDSGWRVHTAGFGAKTTFNGATGAFGYSNVASSQSATASFTPIERLTILANGNVGIGTTTPDYKLEVEGASGTTVAIKTPWAANAYGQYKFQTPVGEASMRSRVPGNSTIGLEFYTYGTGNSTAKMSILGGGNVGIGETNPLVKLDVKGSPSAPANSGTAQTGSLRVSQTAGNGVLDMGFYTSSNGTAWLQSTNKTNLATNYDIALQPNGGNVGIGTTSPAGKLDVEVKQGSGGFMVSTSSSTDNDSHYQVITCANVLATSGTWYDVAYVTHSPTIDVLGRIVANNLPSNGGAGCVYHVVGMYGSVTAYEKTYQMYNNISSFAGTGAIQYRYLNSGASSGSYRLQVRGIWSNASHNAYAYTTIRGMADGTMYEDD